jgi:hypothetical protein
MVRLRQNRPDRARHSGYALRESERLKISSEVGQEGVADLRTALPGQGIEYVIQALPEINRQHPDLIYIVLGATHPHLVRTEGESYRLSLGVWLRN